MQLAMHAAKSLLKGWRIIDNSYMQSQAGKALRCSFRIQTSLLFVVPLSGRTASN